MSAKQAMLVTCLTTLVVIGESLHLTKAVSIDLTNVTCTEPMHVVEDGGTLTSYHVTWDGRTLPENCRLGFNLTDLDTFQICVNIETFSLETCAFHMQYFESSASDLKKSINCGSSRKEYCSQSNELYIKFTVSHQTTSRVAITVAPHVRSDKSVLIAIGCVLSVAAFCAFFVTMCALRKNARNERKSCLIWKCLDVCIPEKIVQPSSNLDFTLQTITIPFVDYSQVHGSQSEVQSISETISDPPPPYDPPPPTYEEVHNPKFEGRINIQDCAIDDVRTELSYSGMKL